MSQTLDAVRAVTVSARRSTDRSDQTQVLIFCAIGLVVSLVALLVAPGWVFQPQDFLQMP